MPGGNDFSKILPIGSGPRAATLSAITFFLSAPFLFAQTDPQPSPETKAEKNSDDKSEKKANDQKKQKTEDPERKFAAQCGIDFDKATRRLLINSLAKGWREYTDTTRPPELADEEELFTLRADSSGKRYVRAVHLRDDFDTYQDDCFGESGKLKLFHSEFRTIWGWAYEEARTYEAT